MNNKTNKQMVPLFNPILNKNTDNLINNSFAPLISSKSSTTQQPLALHQQQTNTLNINKALNSKPISHKKMLELYLKGIKLYDNNLSSFSSNWNNKYLILSLKKTNFSSLPSNPSVSNTGYTSASADISNSNRTEKQDLSLLSSNSTSLASTETQVQENKLRLNKYLKSISLNSNNKGKVINYSEIISYNFIAGNNKLIKNIYSLLEYSFFAMSSLISKPVFEITPEKVVVHLYFFVFNKGAITSEASEDKRSRGSNIKNRNLTNLNQRPAKQRSSRSIKGGNQQDSNTFLNVNSSKLNKICEILSGYFKKPVELELVRLYYPYFNSNILVNLFGLIINKIKVRFIMKNLFKKAIIKNPSKLPRKNRLTIIPSFLSGIKIRIAGRLLTHRVVPRKTVKIIRRGALARGKVKFLDVARFTNKNKRGAFSITISAGQNFS
jgi:hypothetical protein